MPIRTNWYGDLTLHPEPKIREGIALQRRGDFEAAASIYTEMLDRDPEHVQALHYLGLVRYQQDRLEEAAHLLTDSLQRDPRNPNAWSDLGMVRVRADAPEEALVAELRRRNVRANRVKNLTALLLIGIGFAGYAQTESTDPMQELRDMWSSNKQTVTDIVNNLSKCSAHYEVTADFIEVELPASAEFMRGQARGARSAAIYLLGWEYAIKNEFPKRYGEFETYVEDIIEGNRVYLAAIIELGDDDSILKIQEECIALHDVQVILVEQMSDELTGR